MKTIEEMWQEYARQTGADVQRPVIRTHLRRAFFAGFNRMYNIATRYEMMSIDEYETEMDAHSEESYEDRG